MLNSSPLVFLLDDDNTLLDNDRFARDLGACLQRGFGSSGRERYFSLHARLRRERGCADYLGALREFRLDAEDPPAMHALADFLGRYPFWARLYPHALESLQVLGALGPTVILAEGDTVFQADKIERSGLSDAVAGRVVVCRQKTRALDQVQWCCPADHYVMIDDDPRMLAAAKSQMLDSVTTIFVSQGHHAVESRLFVIDQPPDFAIRHIGDLCRLASRHGGAAFATLVPRCGQHALHQQAK